jgi:quercetin dioxygenase-like cupin family protein
VETVIMKGGRGSGSVERPTETFSGEVLADRAMAAKGGVAVTGVSFAPGARTFWHTHETGQVLVVTSGAGAVAERSGARAEIAAGDVVFIPADVEHWHGALPDSPMTHLAISLRETRWLEAVSEADYRGG